MASTNVLTNPGAELGLANWTLSLNGYIYAVNTNGWIDGGNHASGHLFVHSGSNEFQLFDTTGNGSIPGPGSAGTAFIYQDFPAAPGSQWSPSCWAICYASNYFNPGASAHMQIAFYDSTGTNLCVDPTYGISGVYGSDFLDPVAEGFPFTIVPPAALDPSGWLYLSATNFYAADPASEANWVGPVSLPLIAPSNTAFVRYQIEFDNSITDGGDVYWDDLALTKVVGTDPDIIANPASVTLLPTLPAQFTVVATKAVKAEVLTYQWQKNGTNLPPTGGVGSILGGTTNATLYFSSCQPIDDGQYAVVVTDTNGSIRSVPVTLTVTVLNCEQLANVLGANSGFENLPAWPPWNIFNGCYATTANVVPVFDGTYCAATGDNGDRDNGFWQSVPAAPGTVWKAGGWAYIPSTNDFQGGNTCRLQIWFKDSFGNSLSPPDPVYESFKIYGLGYTNADAQYTNVDTSSPQYGQLCYHAQLPRDRWCLLQATNMVNNSWVTLFDDLPTNTLPSGDFVVPADASVINFQVYEYCPVAADPQQADLPGVATDVVYWDDVYLAQVLPVTNLTATVSGGHANVSFYGSGLMNYTVFCKTNLTDPTWTVLVSNIPGACANITVSDSLTAGHRFYRVQTY